MTGDRDQTRKPPTADSSDPISVFPEGELDLRDGADDCYKCSTCDTNCPVAAVDDSFPGPKFQGPEQWRLKRKDDHDIDSSVMDCSNCMRCDDACPTGVPLSQMHNEARGVYVANQQSKRSRAYWRNRLLANYRSIARVASTVPRLTNFLLNSRITRWINDRVLGITSEREFPAFAQQTFREWWNERGGHAESKRRAREARERRENSSEDGSKGVAYFHGCYANYNTPEVAKSMVRVFEYFGYEVTVPDQGCSGTPMFANGMLDDARRDADTNVSNLGAMIADGYDIICSCTSCSMSLKQEYPELFDIDGIDNLSEHTFEALEYLRIHEDLRSELEGAELGSANTNAEAATQSLATEFAYHAPCHARNQGLDRQALELFGSVEAVDVTDVGDSCSGISGTYGWKSEKYDTSMAIGQEMFEHMNEAPADTGMTECPTCAMQMEHGTGYEIRHPLEVLAAALDTAD